jgi:hypothetical protein
MVFVRLVGFAGFVARAFRHDKKASLSSGVLTPEGRLNLDLAESERGWRVVSIGTAPAGREDVVALRGRCGGQRRRVEYSFLILHDFCEGWGFS